MPEHLVDGVWTAGSGTSVEVLNPYDADVLATFSSAGPDDVESAVRGARRAFDGSDWPRTSAAERAGLLRRVAKMLQRDKEEIARIETLDTGKTLVESRIDIDDVVAVFTYYANLVETDVGRADGPGQPNIVSRIVHDPGGVCVLITPWNYPLLQLSWKIAPAVCGRQHRGCQAQRGHTAEFGVARALCCRRQGHRAGW